MTGTCEFVWTSQDMCLTCGKPVRECDPLILQARESSETPRG
jgi:hypothetical protein